MDESRSFETIDPETFDELLSAYADAVPAKLSGLDKHRYEEIPSALKERKPADLTKEQVSTLVDWKLSHGKFRPTLKALLEQNPTDIVQSQTSGGFEAYSRGNEYLKESLKILTDLKGIGPATASLLLSVYDPENAPFFSDELFRWSFYEEGKGKGWDRNIKYNLNECLQLFEKVRELKRRFRKDYQREVSAVEIEKVAYVLGKRGVGADAGEIQAAESQKTKRKAPTDEKPSDKPKKAAKPDSASRPVDNKASKPAASSRTSGRSTRKR